MTLLLVAIGVALLAFPALADRMSAASPPREWSRVVAATLVGGVIVTEVGLVLTALPTVLHVPAIAQMTGACPSIVDRINAGPVLGWTSFVAALASLVAIAVTIRRCRRLAATAWVEPWLGDHLPRDGYELVVVPTARVLAMSVPGTRPQVVVSDAVVARLDQGRLDAVIEHEAAHLRLGHRRYLLIAAAVDRAFGWVPGARRSADSLRVAVEEWADDVAVGSSRSRRHHLRGALETLAEELDLRSGSHAADARLLRLSPAWSQAPIGGRLIGYSPAASLFMAGVAVAGLWLGASHHLIALGGYCPR